MVVFLWIWQFLSPIVIIFGGLYMLEDDIESTVFILGGIASVLGLIVGIVGWGDTIPPRWFWVKSGTELIGSKIMTSIGYAFQFFFIPAFVFGIIDYFG